MITNIHVCSFSGSVADLAPRDKKDNMKVLRCLKSDPMVSTWDMGEHGLWKTIKALEELGFIKSIDVEYPWCKYILTESGIEKLKQEGV